MENSITIKHKKIGNRILFVLLLGIVLRTICLIYLAINNSVHCDEAMLILNARSLADSGIDILGRQTPIYFDTWLWSGQSPLATYLVALFIKVFGYSLMTSRIPIFLFSIIGMVMFYKLVGELFHNENIAFYSLLLVAISPWHIMQSVWTLDCNFMPHLLVIAMYFLVRAANGINRTRNYIISMVFFALCFYSYIAALVSIPVFMVLMLIFFIKKKVINPKQIIYCFITFIVAMLPIILFGLVNTGLFPEINLFGLSILKMGEYSRNSDLILTQIIHPVTYIKSFFSSFVAFIRILFGISVLSTPTTYSFFSHSHILGTILMIIGTILLIKKFKDNKGQNDILKYLLISLFVTLLFYLISMKINVLTEYRHGFILYFIYILEGYALYYYLVHNITVTKCNPKV